MSETTVERVFPARIVKADGTKRIAYGVVLEPRTADDPDTQGDWYDAETVEQAAHSFAKHVFGGDGWGDLMHDEVSVAGVPVESFIAPVDYVLGTGETAQLVKAGSWVIGMHYPDEAVWDLVVKGELAAFSVGGRGKRILEEAA